jgi:hypothetical protein
MTFHGEVTPPELARFFQALARVLADEVELVKVLDTAGRPLADYRPRP